MTRIPLHLAATATLLLPLATSFADVKLPAIFSDHMVLEKTAKVPIWGKADPGEKVTITLGDKTATATAGEDGKWIATLDLKDAAAGPFEVTVQGKNQIKITDVVVGEVWVASGQSNMEWVLKNTIGAEEEIANSTNPLLRQFLVKKSTQAKPTEALEGAWVTASPTTSGSFTAVGYYFAKDLQNALKVPVGLIHTSWGGTPSEAWTSQEAIKTVPDLQTASEKLWANVEAFPEKLKSFVTDFNAWLTTNDRLDKKTDRAEFAGVDVSTDGWTTVKLPGVIKGEGLPANGAIWLRQDVNVTEKPKAAVRLNFGVVDGFDSFYWNGKLVKETTAETTPGDGVVRYYSIPAEDIKVGRNVAALRIFAPATPAQVKSIPSGIGFNTPTDWLAKAEFAFPALTAEAKPAPVVPIAPMGPQNVSSYLYNGMINPIVPYAIKGAIWYQGESNAGRSYQYRTAFPLMITDWRTKWDQGDFPFYFCQLANYQPKAPAPAESGWAELREAQSLTLKLPNTGQAILIDLGESGDIHPRNKKDVGQRLARIALAKDYGKDVVYSGPVFKSQKVEDGKIRLTFDQLNGGLVAQALPETYDVQTLSNKKEALTRNSPKSELEGFAICGEDKQWVWADAKIDGDDVVVWSDKVAKPVAVRYGWANNPTVNLYNKAGLPASPFRTDDFPTSTLSNKYQ